MKPANVGRDSIRPDELYDEFEKALSKLKNRKATRNSEGVRMHVQQRAV